MLYLIQRGSAMLAILLGGFLSAMVIGGQTGAWLMWFAWATFAVYLFHVTVSTVAFILDSRA